MSVAWVDVVLDRRRVDVDEAAAFWAQVAGGVLSPWRDDHTFATVVPPRGDDYLRVQGVDGLGPRGGAHLDLSVADPVAEGERLRGLGATVLGTEPGLVLLRSPAGLAFCLTPLRVRGGGHRPAAVGAPASRLDQATLDLPASAFEREGGFWAEATGWEPVGASAGEFRVLRPPAWGSAPDDGPGPDAGLQAAPPVRLLLQRLGEGDGPAGVHVDLACEDRAATTARHVALGAAVVGEGRRWTVMGDPSGAPYCLTDRDPVTGALPA